MNIYSGVWRSLASASGLGPESRRFKSCHPDSWVFLDSARSLVERNFPGDRKRIRWFASQQALEMVRRALL